MRSAVLLFHAGLTVGTLTWPNQPPATEQGHAFPHVRSTNGRIRTALDEGYAKSRTFRGLVDSLERSDVILHIERGECACGRARACLTFLADAGGVRYLRSHVSLQQIQRHLIEQIAHELFHAGEILRARHVRSRRAFSDFFAQLRVSGCREPRCYETAGAEAAESAVRVELSSPRQRNTTSSHEFIVPDETREE